MNSGRGALVVDKNTLGRSSLFLLHYAARRFAGGAEHRGIRDTSLVFGDVYRYAIPPTSIFPAVDGGNVNCSKWLCIVCSDIHRARLLTSQGVSKAARYRSCLQCIVISNKLKCIKHLPPSQHLKSNAPIPHPLPESKPYPQSIRQLMHNP